MQMRPSLALLLAAFLPLGMPAVAQPATPAACVAIGAWTAPGGGPPAELYGPLARRRVVLLGESHSNAEDHRWQLQTAAALLGRRPDLVLGFEMFPRRLQPVLDRWVRGELTEAEFLDQSEWRRVWRYDPQLYMPLFHFARMNRIPMLALNIDEALIRRVSTEGWAAIPAGEREGVTDPAPASPDYREALRSVFAEHAAPGSAPPEDPQRFDHFVDAQTLWDSAMAQRLAAAAMPAGAAAPLVVGIVGHGHIEQRFGIPHQLATLGIPDAAVLLPWGPERECAELKADTADLVFGTAAPEKAPAPPRLGVGVARDPGAPRIESVQPASVAERTGLQKDDVILEAAGRTLAGYEDLTEVIGRQAPGTWLPLKVKRGDSVLTLVAEFPR